MQRLAVIVFVHEDCCPERQVMCLGPEHCPKLPELALRGKEDALNAFANYVRGQFPGVNFDRSRRSQMGPIRKEGTREVSVVIQSVGPNFRALIELGYVGKLCWVPVGEAHQVGNMSYPILEKLQPLEAVA